MPFTKQRFALHFSMPLADADWQNLAASRVTLVVIPLPFADVATLVRLRDMGCRVVLRVPEPDYYDDGAPARITHQALLARSYCPLEAVMVGVEPDSGYTLSYDSPDWGQAHAYEHRRRFDAVRRALQGVGVAVLSPGYMSAVTLTTGAVGRTISEDDPPAPGLTAWREICSLPDLQGQFGYLSTNGAGVHLYCYNWAGVVDELRWMHTLKEYAELYHRPLWIDEVGVGNGAMSDLQKMRSYISMAEILLSRPNGRQHPLGARVEMLCPFVSNGDPGNPPVWEPRYVLRERAAYEELGRWMGR